MANTQIMKHCKTCGKSTLHLQKTTSHVLHLLLSVLTAGLWIVIWVLVSISNSTQGQCTECGRAKGAPAKDDYTRLYVVIGIIGIIAVVNYMSN